MPKTVIDMEPLATCLMSKRLFKRAALDHWEFWNMADPVTELCRILNVGRIFSAVRADATEFARLATNMCGSSTLTSFSVSSISGSIHIFTPSIDLLLSHMKCTSFNSITGKQQGAIEDAVDLMKVKPRLLEVLKKYNKDLEKVWVTSQDTFPEYVVRYIEALIVTYSSALMLNEGAERNKIAALLQSFPCYIPLGIRQGDEGSRMIIVHS